MPYPDDYTPSYSYKSYYRRKTPSPTCTRTSSSKDRTLGSPIRFTSPLRTRRRSPSPYRTRFTLGDRGRSLYRSWYRSPSPERSPIRYNTPSPKKKYVLAKSPSPNGKEKYSLKHTSSPKGKGKYSWERSSSPKYSSYKRSDSPKYSSYKYKRSHPPKEDSFKRRYSFKRSPAPSPSPTRITPWGAKYGSSKPLYETDEESKYHIYGRDVKIYGDDDKLLATSERKDGLRKWTVHDTSYGLSKNDDGDLEFYTKNSNFRD